MLTDSLKTTLATSFGFFIKTANYHWNIEGEEFIPFHPWLGELYSGVYDTIDQLAEYLRTLQAYVPASLARYQELSRVADQFEVVQCPVIFTQLLADNQTMIDLYNEVFDVATKERQQGIANFAAERLDFHQKYAWQIRSTLKTVPGDVA